MPPPIDRLYDEAWDLLTELVATLIAMGEYERAKNVLRCWEDMVLDFTALDLEVSE